jgi:hypothetical protein
MRLLLLSALLSTPALAQPLCLERNAPIDPPGEPAQFRGRASLSQVSTDQFGNDIIGDAANEPSIAVDPRAPNRMAIAWRQFDTITSNFRQAGYAWTNDGGRTWHPGRVEPGVFHTDPIVRANADGILFWNMLDEQFFTKTYRSTDGGRTWTSPVNAFGGDKLWMAIDKGSLNGRNNIYEVWNQNSNHYQFTFTRSLDAGASFVNPTPLPTATTFATIAVGQVGQAYIADYFGSFQSCTVPWITSAPIFTYRGIVLGSPANSAPNPDGISGQTQVVVDTGNGPRRGWVYVLGTQQTSGDPSDILLRRSTDGGQTWSPAIRVNSDPPGPNSYQWFGTISIAPNGRLDVVWNDTSVSQTVNLCRTVYRSSSDGGTTWSPLEALTPQWNSFIGWPNQNKIGDYYDIESDNLGADLAFATTVTGGQDVFYRRLGSYDCNRNDLPDDAEIAAGTAMDCNHNGIPDSCEIAAGALDDRNHNNIPDTCEDACSPDFNHDGDSGTDQDIEAFFACIAGSCCATCGSPDYNADGDAGTDADIESFFSVLAGGNC